MKYVGTDCARCAARRRCFCPTAFCPIQTMPTRVSWAGLRSLRVIGASKATAVAVALRTVTQTHVTREDQGRLVDLGCCCAQHPHQPLPFSESGVQEWATDTPPASTHRPAGRRHCRCWSSDESRGLGIYSRRRRKYRSEASSAGKVLSAAQGTTRRHRPTTGSVTVLRSRLRLLVLSRS
jgi:hypothetical protein